MPTPNKDEKESEFMERCVPIVLKDGSAKDQDQAVAMCTSMFEEWQKKRGAPGEAELRFTGASSRVYQVAAELRVIGTRSKPKIVGYAARFDSDSVDLGGFIETIAPGAFKRSLAEAADVRALIDHDPSKIIGRTKSGTLALREDEKGLLSEIDPPDTQTARDLIACIERGDIDGMSFGFLCRKDEWTVGEEGKPERRRLLDVDLLDVSAVTFPAYPDTQVAVRSLQAVREEQGRRWLAESAEALKRRGG